jgi:hypothetical protein
MHEVLKGFGQLSLQPHTELEAISIKLDAVAESIFQLQKDMDTARSNQDTLRALRFDSFNFRHDHIPVAHTMTFEWAYSDKAPGVRGSISLRFRDWLRNHDGIFWIRGKAGSGKSTLMKFLCNDERTMSTLQTWAGDGRRLVIAKYFFWNPGTPLQKSQEGLMRSLLFDILCHCPEHIPKVHDRLNHGLKDIKEGEETWTREVLWQLLKEIISENTTAKICFFVDGLDEIDGDSENLIDTVKALANRSAVKICVSSRPWAEFVHEFGTDSNRVLKVEDLTAGDIRRYAHESLLNNSRFRRLADKDPTLFQLQDEIVSKSDGVFLWVNLAVRSLLQGLKYADTKGFLWKRLRSFPPDLDEFFLHILMGIPDIYRNKAAGTFKTAMAASSSMPAMVYHFIDCVEENEDFALDCPWEAMPPDETAENIENMVLRLDGWTKGLLEVVNYGPQPDYANSKVEFLHRTARDFIEESGHARQLLGRLHNPQQGVSGMICHGSLAFLKCHPRNKASHIDYEFLMSIFKHAALVADDDWRVKRIHPVLDDVGKAMVEDGRDWKGTGTTSTMCKFAAEYGLKDYIQETLQSWDYTESGVGWYGVNTETFYTDLLSVSLQSHLNPPVQHDRPWAAICWTVAFLIDKGADPNAMCGKGTIWGGFLRNFGYLLRSGDRIIIDICRTLVAAGAALDVPWANSQFHDEIRVILPKVEAAELLALAPHYSEVL